MHDLLALRHAAATARVAALRQPEVLRDAWREALAGGKVPGAPWALLTHPPSASLQDGLAVDVRGWLFEQARAGQAGRDVQQQAQQQAASQRAEAEALLEARATAPGPAADLASNQARASRHGPGLQARWPTSPPPSTPSLPARGPGAPPSLHGRRVLCVGAMPGAQARYRELLETAGAASTTTTAASSRACTGSTGSSAPPTWWSARPAASSTRPIAG